MIRFLVAGVVALFLLGDVCEARPRRRSSHSSIPSGYSNATAQDVANSCAAMGRLAHLGGNSGLEGIGMASTPEAAICNCCYYGQIRISDQGVAQGSNGMWYACIRGN